MMKSRFGFGDLDLILKVVRLKLPNLSQKVRVLHNIS